jgi:hypothetical protein
VVDSEASYSGGEEAKARGKQREGRRGARKEK